MAPLSISVSHLSPAPNTFASPQTVCVMDASGSIGAALVDKLLRRGYTVHAATCNLDAYSRLQGVSREKQMQLEVFRSDPFDYQSIVDAVKGCTGLFYCFEPPQEQSSYDEFIAEVEMRAALNVVEACAQSDTMEKVVFTSSVTAVVWKENRRSSVDLDERDWSDPNFCRKFKLWYALAKTLAEKTAWSLAMDRGVHMISINAGLLTGPELTAKSPSLKGAPEMYRDGVLVTVDINFLVDAHVCAFESSSTYGRYLCFNQAVCRPEDAVKLAQMLTPSAAPCAPPSDDLRLIQQRIHNKKLKQVMADFHGTGGGIAVIG